MNIAGKLRANQYRHKTGQYAGAGGCKYAHFISTLLYGIHVVISELFEGSSQCFKKLYPSIVVRTYSHS